MEEISCDNLDEAIDHYTKQLGYRLDMIVPADNPREALLSLPSAVADGLSADIAISNQPRTIRLNLRNANVQPPATAGGTDTDTSEGKWIVGRAGMEYRDLIPGRLGGRMIASHIRLAAGGEVPDYVHYHKVDFQMIYCKRGRIKVVYEDQGPPFWLDTGDCVLQPSEIRHRVLECTAGAEVIEVSMPAEHETWVEHDITLPTAEQKPDRDFNGQRFLRHIAKDATWRTIETECEIRDTRISVATGDLANVIVSKPLLTSSEAESPIQVQWDKVLFLFVLKGEVGVLTHVGDEYALKVGDNCIIPPNLDYRTTYSKNAELLEVSISVG